jgi:hypothetical protein
MAEYTDDQRQHLAFIQDVITRMNSNSFSLKGLMITVVAALSAFFASNYDQGTGVIYLGIGIFLVLVFWLFDAYYLMMEKQYRALYNDAVFGNADLYKMDASGYSVGSFGVMFSKSEWPMYLPIIIIFAVAIFLVL